METYEEIQAADFRFRRENNIEEIPAVAAMVANGGWNFPPLPEGNVRVSVPPIAGLNDRELLRLDGKWYVRWPGFAWREARQPEMM